MTPETAQEISKALNRLRSDLSNWLRQLRVPETEIIHLYFSAIRENGMLARLLMSEAASVSASSGTSEIRPDRIEQEFGRLESGEYAAWLLSQPEPTPDQLSEIIELCKSALPNLRRRFQRSAKLGPRHRRGGRPVELPDPELRKSIRETIKRLREPGTSLESLYKRLARKYGVSASTIKRIWAEGKRPDDGT